MSARGPSYHWETMKRGEERFIPGGRQPAISSALSYWRRRHPGWYFRVKSVEGGVRVVREL